MSVLGVIPARGGSKGVPKKNIRSLGGKPLIGWACEAALAATEISRLVVSTDSQEIADLARQFGVETPFLRPAEFATDQALIVDVLDDLLKRLDSSGNTFDYVCLLQPTTPFVSSALIDDAIRLAREKNADTVIAGAPCAQHPAIMFTKDGDSVNWVLGMDQRMKRRQDYPQVFIRAGSPYVFRASMIRNERALYGSRLFSIETTPERALAIDTPMDFKMAEFYLQEGLIKP